MNTPTKALPAIIAEMRGRGRSASGALIREWADRLTAALAAQDAALSAPRAGEDAALAFIREVRESPNTINNADWTQGFHDALDYLLRELPARIAAPPSALANGGSNSPTSSRCRRVLRPCNSRSTKRARPSPPDALTTTPRGTP